MNAVELAQSLHLLDAIKTAWLSFGDVMNDTELTCFLRQRGLGSEAGFEFLCFVDGNVTLTVPEQDPADWYAAEKWIAPAKEKIAAAIAKKYGFMLHEPLDGPLSFGFQGSAAGAHHHLALDDKRQTVIVAHPLFLKVRVLGEPLERTYRRDLKFPLSLAPELLQDLAPLYRHSSGSD